MKKEQLSLFKKIPMLSTDRLILRRISTNDLDDVYEYASDEKVSRYLLWHPHIDKRYTKDYLSYINGKYKKGEFYDWGIELRSCGKMIGTCGFTSFDIHNNSAEIGYVLNSNFWGMEIAKEAAMRVIEFGFKELALVRIEAHYIIENKASRRVMEKCGMTFEGIKRRGVKCKGEYPDVGICSITNEEYFNFLKR